MDLNFIESKWEELKKQEAELVKQLEDNQTEQVTFFKQAVNAGYYQQGGKWAKNESCSTCKHCISSSCLNETSKMYLRVVDQLGCCSNGWTQRSELQ